MVLIIHVLATWFMVGLIWVVQLVHYPAFDWIDRQRFVEFEAFHAQSMGRVLAVPAVTEVATGATLVWVRPSDLSIGLVLGSGLLLAGIWSVTALVQVPQHRRLGAGFEAEIHRRLVSRNWWRTAAWTVRGVTVGVMLIAI